MIQELLGGAGLIGGERKISADGVLEASPSPSPSPSTSPSPSSSTTTINPPTSSSAASETQNLKCPRCDSTNTKFCYYNNYNLTQPRHFCKTCRRYWTKGGALRNVPIGGGCRKNKNVGVAASVGKSSAGRLKNMSCEIGKSALLDGFGQEVSSNPILWASPQHSHILALLRANQNTNPNPNPTNTLPNPNPVPNSVAVKEENVLIGSHMNSESARALGLDPFSQAPSIGPFWRSNEHHQAQQQNGGFILGEVQNTGIQELYQRLRPSAHYYPDHSSPILLTNAASTSANSSTILESAPVAVSELGFCNPTLSWSDLPTTHGAYP